MGSNGGTGGRKTPQKLHILHGNPSRRPKNVDPDREPQPRKLERVPKPPIELAQFKVAKREWKRIADELYRLNLLTVIDKTALTQYCFTYQSWIECVRTIRRKGFWLKDIKGRMIQNPAVKESIELSKHMKTYLVEFGMTPSSRSRLDTEKLKTEKSSDKEDLDAMLK